MGSHVFVDGMLKLRGSYAELWLEAKFSPPHLNVPSFPFAENWTCRLDILQGFYKSSGTVCDLLSSSRMEWLGRSYFANLLSESNFHI